MTEPPTPAYGNQPGQSPQPVYGPPLQGPPAYGQQPGQQFGQQPGQPGSPQAPGYGQPGAMGPETTRMARLDPGPSQSVGVPGAVLTAIGAALVIVAFTAVNWFTKGTSGHSKASDLHKILDDNKDAAVPLSRLYFAWLGWALLVVVVILAVLAILPSPVSKAFRILGAIVAVLAIAATFLAIHLDSSDQSPAYSEYLKHARLGFYFAVGGFLLLGIGAVLGPRQQR